MIINKCDIWWIKKYGTKKERRALENYYKAQKKKRKKSTRKVQANLKSPKPKKYQRTKITPELKNWIILTRKKLISNQTDSEKEFYDVLETLNIKFDKQKPFVINNRVFFADAVFEKTKTIIEIDGIYHNSEKMKSKDRTRTQHLNGIGYKVIRLTNDEINDIPLFMSKICNVLPEEVPAYLFV